MISWCCQPVLTERLLHSQNIAFPLMVLTVLALTFTEVTYFSWYQSATQVSHEGLPICMLLTTSWRVQPSRMCYISAALLRDSTTPYPCYTSAHCLVSLLQAAKSRTTKNDVHHLVQDTGIHMVLLHNSHTPYCSVGYHTTYTMPHMPELEYNECSLQFDFVVVQSGQ